MLMDLCELSPSYVRSIAPYQPGKPISELAREMGLEEAQHRQARLQREPARHRPAHARRDRGARSATSRAIPDGNGFELKQALARRYGVDMGAIVLGNGSNDVLELVALAFLGPGRAAVYSQHCFAVYPLATQARGARAIVVPAKDYGHDLEAMAEAIDDETYVVLIANPNNPDRHLRAPRGDRGLPRARARARARGARRGLQRIPAAPSCAATASKLAQAPSRTWSSRAPSPRPTASPGCAWATRSRIRRSPT